MQKLNLDKEQIDTYLFALDKSLRKKIKNPVDIVMCGGAAMIAGYGENRGTVDIDAYWAEVPQIKEAIIEVSEQFNIDPKWLNKDFTKTASFTRQIVSNCYLYKQFIRLNVYIASAELLFCMKLIALQRNKGTDIIDINYLLELMSSQQIMTLDHIKVWMTKYFGENYNTLISDIGHLYLSNKFGA